MGVYENEGDLQIVGFPSNKDPLIPAAPVSLAEFCLLGVLGGSGG